MTNWRKIEISLAEVIKGVMVIGPVVAVLITVSWNLSSRLTSIENKQDAQTNEIRRIEKHLKMDAVDPTQSYNDGVDPLARMHPPTDEHAIFDLQKSTR